ncbi:zinc ribbon domain-containing protein, partial [Sphingomonas sp.]|uniref:zinc ribbon domain-containing protein n=1 Tax=Sphingomonas sp. TaxID=28214 RepID=UPI0035A82D5B
SGLTKCSCCGGGFSQISATLIGCSTARNKGTCDNRLNIRRDELEARVLTALRTKLVDPELFAHFCEVFTQEMNRLRVEGRAGIATAEAEIARIDREIDTLVNMILKGGAADAINAKLLTLESRKREMQRFLAEAQEPPPMLHPSMALQYRRRVQQLYDALHGDDEERRIEAAEVLRTLVDTIILTPLNGKLEIDVQ